MSELKDDLLAANKILSKYIYEFDNNIGKPNSHYIKDNRMRFPISIAHRNIEFALNYLIDEDERKNMLSEIKTMRCQKDRDDIEVVETSNEEI